MNRDPKTPVANHSFRSIVSRSRLRLIATTGAVLFSTILLSLSYACPCYINWDKEKGTPITFKPSDSEYALSYILKEPNGEYRGYSGGLCAGNIWFTVNDYLDGKGGRYTDAQVNAFEDTHPAFGLTIPPATFFRNYHSGSTSAGFILPTWIPLLLAITAFALTLRRRRAQSLLGCCTRCGYDLRATPDCCPECGQSAAPQRCGV